MGGEGDTGTGLASDRKVVEAPVPDDFPKSFNTPGLKVKKPQPIPWRCPLCQVWVQRYWCHCPGCSHPRLP